MISPEERNEIFADAKKLQSYCSKAIVELWAIMGKLEAIRETLDPITMPRQVPLDCSNVVLPPSKAIVTASAEKTEKKSKASPTMVLPSGNELKDFLQFVQQNRRTK